MSVSETETPDVHGAFPRLDPEQLATLRTRGTQRPAKAGEVLYREADTTCNFFVIVDGVAAIVEDLGGENERVVSVHGPRRFLGEISLLTGQAVFFSAVMREAGTVLEVPIARLRQIVAEDAALGELILRAFLERRTFHITSGAGFRIVGNRFAPDTRRLREFAARNRLPHHFIAADDDQPVVILRTEEVLRNPSNAALAREIGLLRTPPGADADAVCDLLVVGAGPGGLAASVYGASEGLDTVTFDAVAIGGQAGTSSRIENYLGFPAGLSGAELALRAEIQAEKFGARIGVPAEATGIERQDGIFVVHFGEAGSTRARTVVVATGARYRRLPVARLEAFEGVSVHYAATPAEANLCAGDPVVVVGGGNSAGQAALFLSAHVPQVRLLIRHAELHQDMSHYLAERIEQLGNIEVLLNTEVRELVGEHVLEAVVVEDNRSGQSSALPARAMFVFIGAQPHTEWVDGLVALDEKGYVPTGHDLIGRGDDGRVPTLLETSCPGIYAVGDVRSGSIKRVATAVGEGSMAVRLVFEHLEALKRRPTSPGERAPQRAQHARAN
ncbi:MAG: thioredoxin reductase [Solirubrobacteraceae bacterium]|nr:thioredoxin reductase [Solirubrobacteraceae bacterium]